MRSTTVMVLAGGKGQRLFPLTCHRAKPAVPFGGRYRIIDFVLSNLTSSGYGRIYVLTQYMASSLIRHLNRTWHLQSPNQFLEVVPAQMRSGGHWYRGTADSVWQNANLIGDSNTDNVAVFGGDHVYKFDVSQMEDFHDGQAADVTIAAYPVPIEQAAGQFGVFEVDESGRLLGFEEKPEVPKPIPGNPSHALVSMGNYIFKSDALRQVLREEMTDPESSHDFGRGIIPRMLDGKYTVAVYDFADNVIDGEPEGAEPYWRDVGTLDSYFDANMDLRSPVPNLNLYNFLWRIRAAQRNFPPARFVRHDDYERASMPRNSLVCEGTIVVNSTMRDVVSGYDCYFHADAHVEDAVILSGCDIGARARLRGVLFDKNVRIAPETVIGEDEASDRERFPFITPMGRVVLPKGTYVPKAGPIELTSDMEAMLRLDPTTAELMQRNTDRYSISDRNRHSHDSVGPRFRDFGPGALE